MSVDIRLEKIEKRLRLLEKKRRKQRELSLKEKFAVHDRKEGLVRWFDTIVTGLPHENVWFCVTVSPDTVPTDMRKVSIKDLKEIVKNLANLVDNALGAKF